MSNWTQNRTVLLADAKRALAAAEKALVEECIAAEMLGAGKLATVFVARRFVQAVIEARQKVRELEESK